MLKRIAAKLPIGWDAETIKIGSKTFDSESHALIAIYPNPLNPNRYVVLNSGFTFREYDYLNNARQVPKLPDWAVIDLRTPPELGRYAWQGRGCELLRGIVGPPSTGRKLSPRPAIEGLP